VGSASSEDVVLLRGQLEAARSEAESAALQWAAERESLVAAAADLYGEMQRTHAALEAAVAQVSTCAAAGVNSASGQDSHCIM
jgi:outer membrane protein TolC